MPIGLRSVALLAAVSVVGVGQSAPDFATDIWPVIESSCVSCHRATYTDARGLVRRPKGGLRLDDLSGFQAGGKTGPILFPREPAKSALFTLVSLPADHPDLMPANGPKLSPDRIASLRRWIEAGADFGTWTGKEGAKPSVPTTVPAPQPTTTAAVRPHRLAAVRELARGVTAPSTATLEDLEKFAQVQPEFEGSTLFRVRFVSLESTVNDRLVARLMPLAANISALDLSGTAVTDAAARTLAAMMRLTRLDLAETEIGDATLDALRNLPQLQILNLFGTDVTDRSVESLTKGLPGLRKVYLRDTKVSPNAVARLREARPQIIVSFEVEWPEPPPEPSGRPNRRRAQN